MSRMLINTFNRWLSDRYGSRRGAALTYFYRIRFLIGGYRQYKDIDWGSIERLVFVCKGNICRSAYAGAVAKFYGYNAISCGIETVIGAPADKEAIIVGAEKGIDLAHHRTTPIQSLVLDKSDLLVVMEPWQAEYINQEYGEKCRCSMLGLWGRPVKPHIQDPYGASSLYFNYCFDYIEKAVHEITSKICKTKQR